MIDRERLSILIQLYLDEIIEPADLEELSLCLENDAQARKFFAEIIRYNWHFIDSYRNSDFLELMGINSQGGEDAADHQSSYLNELLSMEEAAQTVSVRYTPQMAAESTPRALGTSKRAEAGTNRVIIIPTWFATAAALAAVLLLALGVWTLYSTTREAPDFAGGPSNQPQSTDQAGDGANEIPFTAVVLGVALTSDDSGTPSYEVGDQLAGHIELGNEFVELQLNNGVHIGLQGPLSGELVSATEMALVFGRAQVDVRNSRDGFSIQAPTCRFRDIGTVYVVDQQRSGNSRLYVLEGEVVIDQDRPGQAVESARVLGGQTAEVSSVTGQIRLQDSISRTFEMTAEEVRRRLRTEAVRQATAAYWRFEQDTIAGIPLPHTSGYTVNAPAVLDASGRGNHLYVVTQSVVSHPTADRVPSDRIPATGLSNHQSLYIPRSNTYQDLFTYSNFSQPDAGFDVHEIMQQDWTLEFSFLPEHLNGVQVIAGRDGDFKVDGEPKLQSALACQLVDDRLQLTVVDERLTLHEITREELVSTQRWMHVAIVKAGNTVRLYARDGDGPYREVGHVVLDGGFPRDLLYEPDSVFHSWTIGRGMIDFVFAHAFVGYVDEVRIVRMALEPADFLFARSDASASE